MRRKIHPAAAAWLLRCTSTQAVLSILEPVAIVIIGAVVGLVAVAIFLAITAVNKLPTL